MVLCAFAESGQSRAEFAAQHGIHEQRLYQWQRRLASSDAETAPAMAFRELPVPAALESAGPFELVLPSGMVLRVPSTFEPTALSRLLQVLRHAG